MKKRALSGTSSDKKVQASMTVEAALVLPVFLFCVLNVLFSFRMLETQSRVYAAVHQTGNQICVWGYGEKYIPGGIPDSLVSVVASEGYARTKVLQKIGNVYLQHSGVKAGALGLSFLGSDIMTHNDIVDIQVHWFTTPFIGGYGLRGFPMGVRYYGRAWTGYDSLLETMGEGLEEQMVYITEHGTVYHRTRDCYHLNTSVEQISASAVEEMKNRQEKRYRACDYCGEKNMLQPVCYITPEGDCYHYNVNCLGLKRTVYTIPLSKAGDKMPCMSCN